VNNIDYRSLSLNRSNRDDYQIISSIIPHLEVNSDRATVI